MHLRRNPGSSPGQVLRVVLVVDTRTQRRAVLVEHRYRLGCADALSWVQSALPDRVSLQRRQAVYVSECLSSALPSEAACSLQCQYECSYPRQAGSAAAKRWCPGRVFHGLIMSTFAKAENCVDTGENGSRRLRCDRRPTRRTILGPFLPKWWGVWILNEAKKLRSGTFPDSCHTLPSAQDATCFQLIDTRS